MIIACHHISKAFLEQPILSDVTFQLEKGEHAALVGVNGAGKTTLLRILLGETEPDSGSIARTPGLSIGYLSQTQDLTSSRSIREEVESAMAPLFTMEKEVLALEKALEEASAGEDPLAATSRLEAYEALLERFVEAGGRTFRGEIRAVLKGLSFADADMEKPIAALSGGEKTRVALAKLLLQNASLLILDEPTNHLDIESLRFLEGYLRNYKGTLLLVSHDRYFLDRVVDRVLELENHHLLSFPGNYSAYASRKKALREEERRAYLHNQAQIKHQEEVIRKLRQFNREKSIRRAESREKALAKMDRTAKPFVLRDEMHLAFTPLLQSGRDVLHVEGLSHRFGARTLFSDLSFDLRRGEHVAILGANGVGKTTLLKILNGHLTAEAGIVRTGVNVQSGYYDQELHVLDPDNTIFEEISDAFPAMTNTEIRSLLAAFLFTGDDVFKKIADTSGGEKGRISLAKLMLSGANLLYLDEPTNHLDMASRAVLESALNRYEGTVLYVSHDRYFINRTASRILEIREGRCIDHGASFLDTVPEKYYGNYDRYLEKTSAALQTRDEAQTKSPAPTAPRAQSESLSSAAAPAAESDWKKQKEAQAALRKLKASLERIEADIASEEASVSSLEERLTAQEVISDPEQLALLSKELAQKNDSLSALYKQWEEAAALLSEAEKK